MSKPFTYAPLGSVEFNLLFDKQLNDLYQVWSEASGKRLAGLIVCGGYGRGEGAVLREAKGREYAWNDVDLVPVALKGGRTAVSAALHSILALTRQFEATFRVHLDIGRVVEERDLQKIKPVLLWIETARGHRIIGGDPTLLSRNLPFSPDIMPSIGEALKLLLNRGTGLLLAWRKNLQMAPVHFDCSDEYFVSRNMFKCALAIGDALLMGFNKYQTPLAQKSQAFATISAADLAPLGIDEPESQKIQRWYTQAIDYKLNPGSYPRVPESDQLAELAMLWQMAYFAIEKLRTGQLWANPCAYMLHSGLIEPGEHWGLALAIRNGIHNLRRRKISLRYPREELLKSLPCLLQKANSTDATIAQQIEAFIQLWVRYN